MNNSIFSSQNQVTSSIDSKDVKGSHHSSNLDMSVKAEMKNPKDYGFIVKPMKRKGVRYFKVVDTLDMSMAALEVTKDAAERTAAELNEMRKRMNVEPMTVQKDDKGYTENAWRGICCPDRFLPVKEVAQLLRNYIKNDKELNECKWSVTTESYSGGQSITVSLMAAPFEAISDYWKQTHPSTESGYSQHGDVKEAVTPKAFALISKVKNFLTSYNYDDSDSREDYFDRGFYDRYYIGQFEKPFKIIETKAKKIDGEAQNGNSVQKTNLEIIDYSERAIAVIGDTRVIKEKLKKLGGKYNSRLKCGAGWIFSKTRRMFVENTICMCI